MSVDPIAILNAEKDKLVSRDQSITQEVDILQQKRQSLQQERQALRDDIRTINQAITDLQTP